MDLINHLQFNNK